MKKKTLLKGLTAAALLALSLSLAGCSKAEEQKQMGIALAKGILKTLGIAYKEQGTAVTPETPNAPNTIHRVQVGAFKNLTYAQAMRDKLKADGYDAYIVSTTI